MTIMSSISTAFPNGIAGLSLSPDSFGFLEPFLDNYKDSASTAAAVVAILASSYYLYTNVLDLDKPKGYRDIPALNSWKTIYYQFKSLPGNVKYSKSMKDVQEKYGISRVTMFGVKTIHLANPEYARQMLKDTDIFPKLDMVKEQPTSLRTRLFGYNVALSSGDTWRRQRRICNPAFHRSWSTEDFGEITNKMLAKILRDRKDGSTTIDMGDMAKRMTLDALGKIAFDFDFNSIDNPTNQYSTVYHYLMTNLGSPFYFFFPLLEKIPLFHRPRFRKAVDLFNNLLIDVINKKREKLRLATEAGTESTDSDLLSLMIKANGEEDFSNEELRANMFVFFIAGHDTTANSLACALCHIANDPKVQERLLAEITNVMGPCDASNGTPIPTIEETNNMEYLNAIIKETMRLNSSVEILPPRVATVETQMGPYTIPKGVRVQLNIHSIHHNQKYWDRPEEFDPDRFMSKDKDGNDVEKHNPAAWIPFSSGSRICLGINFSLIEQRVVLCMLLHRFKISLPANSPHKNNTIQFTPSSLKAPKDLKIIFTPRY